MRNNFLNLVAKMPQNTGGGTSRTKNRSVTVNLSSDTTTNREMTERRPREDRETFGIRFLKYAACMLMILFMGIGQMWADETYYLQTPGAATPALTGDFYTTATLNQTVNCAYNDVSYTKAVKFNGNATQWSGNYYPDRMIRYDCKTTKTDFTVVVYSNGNSKSFYVGSIKESALGTALSPSEYTAVAATKDEPTTKTYSIESTTPASFYVSVGANSNVFVVQVIAIEKGENFVKKPGEVGYYANFNKGRLVCNTGGVVTYLDDKDFEFCMSGSYKAGNSTEGQLATNSTHYIKFTVDEPMLLNFTTSTKKKYTVSKTKGSTTSVITPVENKAQKIKLTTADTYYINPQESGLKFTGISFDALYLLTFNAGTGSGSMDADYGYEDEEVKLPDCTFTAPTSSEFNGWVVTKTASGDAVTVTKDGEDYKFTMPAEAVTVTAQWAAATTKFDVTFDSDGGTAVATQKVPEGETASEPTAPTKDCYTFAGWYNGASPFDFSTNITKDVALTAHWTPNYAFGAYSFNALTVGTSPAKTINGNEEVYDDPFRVDNFYFDGGIKIQGEVGTDAEGLALDNFKGWKLKTTGKNIKFLVENNCQVKVAVGSANTLKVIYTALDGTEKNVNLSQQTETPYLVKGGTIVTLQTTTGSTTTLKRITISPLYTATFVDEKGDADIAPASNVSEVTLGAPTEKTVKVSGTDYTFIGWKADKAVKVGGVDKSIGDELNEGDVCSLTDNTTFTAQWQEVSDFDVKFFPGYGENAEIGTTQKISTNGNATAPTDPERDGYRFLGWSTDGTEANIKDIATYAITTATNFTAVWKQVWTVTFDGAGSVEVEDGKTVASPNSPVQAGKVFQGWYNEEVKYDFSAAVTGNLALTSKWADADANHYVYAYNDDFHFDGVVYKTPEGKVDNNDLTSNKAITTPYTLFEGTEGITSIVATGAIYDSKGTHVNAFLKLDTKASSYLTVTIASGYTAVMKVKMGSWNVGSAAPTVTFVDEDNNSVSYTGTMDGKAEENSYAELTYNLSAGTYKMTTATKTLYFSNIDIEATALPTHSVTYKAGDGTGTDVVDAAATEVADVPGTFTAPTGKVFNGWKDNDDNDVEVGTIVTGDMTLTAQWINHYAVTFNMNGHGDAIDPQDIKEGAKATKPADPIAIGFDFGGWFTDEECTAGNEFDFNTSITAATPLYAKWTAFDGCTLLVPATSGDALIVGATVDLQSGSTGATIKVANLNGEKSIDYNAYGLSFGGGGKDSVRVTLNNDLQVGSVVTVRLVSNGTTHENGRGLNLFNAAHVKKALLGWQADEEVAKYDELSFSYTVTETDGFAGTNIIGLSRQNSVFLKWLKVTNCGAAIVYHNVTSAVDPEGKGTVTLGASSVREGRTTTAEYSAIDPLYEFVNWTVSGAGASVADATANPATITVGTEDAVVTLNLRLIPVKFTVNYYDGETLMGTEKVAVNENPTASEITTAKRHYTFLGWSTTNGGDVVALNTITRTEAGTINLYAKYEAVACPTSGTIFSMAAKENELDADVQPNGNTIISLEPYATISGGEAKVGNFGSSKHIKISKGTSVIQFTGSNAFMYMLLDCQLQEGDTIKLEDTEKFTLSIDSLKTKKADIAKNTHFYVVPSEWAGADTILVWRNGNNVSFSSLQVIRPAKYNVSFDLMGHGSAIADIANVLEGSKITAPTAPTDEDYSFAGWYKENTLENAWDFNADVVEANTILYAKWLDKSDATLKSLKYGTTEIELQAGVYEYNVELPSLTSSVPALTAVTNNPNAEAIVTNDDAFDGEGNASSTVEITPEKEGAAHQTYTVNFTKLPSMPLLDVDNSIVWDFDNAGTQNNAFTDEVLANFPSVTNNATFRAQTLKASGAKIKDGYLQGTPVLFHATKAGLLRVEFANTGGGTRPYRYLVINGVRTAYKSNSTTHVTTAWIEVPAGDVTIEGECVEDANGACTSDNLNFYKIEFLALGHERAGLVVGDLGTVCLPNASIARGVTVYEYKGADEIGKIVFEELGTNELLEAGKPYIFQLNETNARFFYNTDPAVTDPDNSTALKGNLGAAITFQPGSADAAHVYFVKDHAFWMAKNTGVKIGQYRCYLQMDQVQPVSSQNPAPGRRRIVLGVQGEQVATGMDELNASEAPVKVMIDGQLFIIRGEKMYNANGQLVK